MKKIDVITIHRNCNYGSVLQTYATQRILEELGFQTEIIDYYREQDKIAGQLKRLKAKSAKLSNRFFLYGAQVIMLPSYIKKKVVFDRFINDRIHVTRKKYYSNEELRFDKLNAHAFCTGSDQIWNSLWNEGIIPAYYLDFASEDSIRFSYATSIGKQSIDDEEAETIAPMIRKYAYISVREKASVETLHRLGFKGARQVLDPTLYISEKEWSQIASEKYKNKKYIVTYNLHRDKRLDEYAQRLAKEKHLPIINISYNWHDVIRKGKLAWCPTVEEYLGLIKYAKYVVADSFHATAFSIQFKKQFLVFYPEKSSIRMRDLLNLTGLNDRGVNNAEIELIDSPINYENIHSIIEQFRLQDKSYLDNVASYINENTRG